MMFGPHDVGIWIVASHRVGFAIEADLFTTEREAKSAYDAIDFENDPLMDCKRMFKFDLTASIGWGSSQRRAVGPQDEKEGRNES